MPTGIKLPIRPKNGRMVLISGKEYTEQLIKIALGDNENLNPFETKGVGSFMLYALNDQQTEGEIRDRVEDAFFLLENDQIARLNSLNFEKKDGFLFIFIDYVDLESGVAERMEVPIPSGG